MGLFSRFGNAAFQEKTSTKLQERCNASPEVAQLAAWAMHPFDDGHGPNRELEKYVRPRSRRFAVELRSVDDEDGLRQLARAYVQPFYHAARALGDDFYTNAWMHALDAAATNGETSLDVFGNGAKVRFELGLYPRTSVSG